MISSTTFSGTIYSLSKLKDETFAIGHGNNISLLNYKTGIVSFQLSGHTAPVVDLKLLNNNQIISSSGDGTIKIWDINKKSLNRTLTGHTAPVRCVIILNNGYAASGSVDKLIFIWNPYTWSIDRTISGNTQGVYSLIQINDKNIVSGSDDGFLRVFNINTGQVVVSILGHSNRINSLGIFDEVYLVSGSADSSLKIWNINTWDIAKNISTNSSIIQMKVLSNNAIATIYSDTFYQIWNPHYGNLISRVINSLTSSTRSISELDDGLLAIGSYDSTVKIWKIY